MLEVSLTFFVVYSVVVSLLGLFAGALLGRYCRDHEHKEWEHQRGRRALR